MKPKINKKKRADAAKRNAKLIHVCALIDNIVEQAEQNEVKTTKKAQALYDRVRKWNGECLRMAGVTSIKGLSSGLLNEYIELAQAITAEAYHTYEGELSVGAMANLAQWLLADVQAVLPEFRVTVVNRLYDSVVKLTEYLVRDESEWDIGTNVYETIARRCADTTK